MKRLFLSSSFADVVSIFTQFADDHCEGKTVTFIATASIPEKVKFYVKAGKKSLEKNGFIIDELEISQATDEDISHKLRHNDYIYVSGGNTFFLLQELLILTVCVEIRNTFYWGILRKWPAIQGVWKRGVMLI